MEHGSLNQAFPLKTTYIPIRLIKLNAHDVQLNRDKLVFYKTLLEKHADYVGRGYNYYSVY